MSSVTQSQETRSSFFTDLQRVLRQNIRQYGMFIALFVIWIFFTVATNGLFISSRNISNLLNQTGYIAVLAVGVTLIIVIRHIDLSIGFLLGFMGAIAAIALKEWGLPVWFSRLLILRELRKRPFVATAKKIQITNSAINMPYLRMFWRSTRCKSVKNELRVS